MKAEGGKRRSWFCVDSTLDMWSSEGDTVSRLVLWCVVLIGMIAEDEQLSSSGCGAVAGLVRNIYFCQ